jgi:hypothetical protein
MDATRRTSAACGRVSTRRAPAVLAVFTYRFFTFWLPIAPAIALLPAARRLADELPGTPREQRPS